MVPEDKSITSVLVPSQVAESCYLSEALYWVALHRFPLASFVEREDARTHDDYIEGDEPVVVYDEVITPEECAAAGIPVSPEWDAREGNGPCFSSSHCRELISRIDDVAARAEFQHNLEEAVAFEERQSEWDGVFESYIDPYAARLFLALRQGDIAATGKCLPVETFAQFKETEEDLSKVEWTVIPKGFWISKKIDWKGSRAEGNDSSYALILVETASLFDAFPIPEAGPIKRVQLVGDGYVLIDDDGRTVRPPATGRGRPSLNWDEFHVEMARRVGEKLLPNKQEAGIADMGEWCRLRWGRPVGRSTLLQKMKPYYDVLIRKSEN